MNLAKRVICGVRGAFVWDNPFELLLDYHLLRRRDPIRLLNDGAALIVNYKSSDMNAAQDILIERMYDQAFNAAFSELKAANIFRYLNLGANIGAFDVRAWQFAKKNGIGVCGAAMEMNTAAFSRLVLNLEINNLLHILPINAALAAADGQIPCELAARDTGQSADIRYDDPQPQAQKVTAMSWQTLWSKVAGNYDLVKVDIEGAEAFWLRSLTCSQAKLLRHVVIETHNADLHSLCDRNLPALGFDLLWKASSAETTRISCWKQTDRIRNPARHQTNE